MVWYYQTSPHDTHDWDSAQTPVLVDGEFAGRPRKLVLQATRNGLLLCTGSRHGRAFTHELICEMEQVGQRDQYDRSTGA